MRKALVMLAVTLSGALVQAATSAESCARLGELAIPGAKITAVAIVKAGAFISPTAEPQPAEAAIYRGLPDFCRVQAEATPSSDSDIKIEVWLPLAGWNRRFLAVGNGGFAGDINYRELAGAVANGYSAGNTDTGHSGSAVDARWALGHPEKINDFGHRGVHEMTRVSKVVIKAFFGTDAHKSYFAGCSNGGRQALMEAQRYPEDYDGILAGAPANYWSHLLTSAVWDAQALTATPASYIPSSKLPAIAEAVNAAYDAQDGVKVGIVNDPRQCHFRPVSMLCKESETDKCLTPAQVSALEKLYGGARDSQGEQIFPGFLPGAEDGAGGWALWITGSAPGKSLLFFFGNGFFANMAYNKAEWDYRQANLDDAVKVADGAPAKILNATDPNLKPFAAHGGKLLLYHGWNDPAISALNSVDYYNAVSKELGQQKLAQTVRLFMVPGMQHCAGGPGPDAFGESWTTAPRDPAHDVQLALEQWVEKETAPSEIIATKYADDDKTVKMTRPLCAYPRAAKYKGNGNSDDAASFVCAEN